MTQNKGLIIASVTASIFFVVILYLLYLLNLKNTLPVIQNPDNKVTGNIVLPSVSPTNTLSNWKTYENKKLGFQFLYPANLKIEETNNFANSPGKWGLTVWRNGSVYFIVDEHNSNGYFNEVVKTPLKFGNNNYQYFNEPGDGEGSYNYDLDKKIEVASFSKDLHSSDPQFAQILSTFKFIGSNNTNTQLQTFNGDGFELKYPKNWHVFPMKNLLLNNCQKIEISKSDAIQLELSPKEYVAQFYSRNLNVDETLTNLETKYKFTFKNLSPNNVAIVGPQGEGEINNLFVKGPEGTGYYNIAVTYIGPFSDPNKTCLGTIEDEYKEILSTLKFL